MAEKKMTQAQRIAAENSRPPRADSKKNSRKEAPEKAKKELKDEKTDQKEKKGFFPGTAEKEKNPYTRWICATVYLLLFLTLLVIALNQEGFLLTFVRSAVFGLFGPVAFYLAIPAMLYLFVLYAFYGDQPTLLRSCCMMAAVFFAGCISHVTMGYQMELKWSMVLDLFHSGKASASGGVLCGLVGGLLESALSPSLALIILSIAAIVCLLSSFRLTIPSLIQAFQDRPRFEDDEEEAEVRPEPAAVLVNSVATRQHEMKQKRQQKKLQQAQEPRAEAPLFQPPWRKQNVAPVVTPAAEQDARGREILRQIADALPDEEPAPVHVVADEPAVITTPVKAPAAPVIPERPVAAPMPAVESAVAPAPVEETPEPVYEQPLIAESANKKVTAEEAAASAQEVTQEIQENLEAQKPVYTFPSIDLLRQPAGTAADGTAEMRENTRRLNEALASFKVDAHVTNVTRGPSVTRYEVELMQGVRLSKLTSVADDIALSLGTSGVRIAPVPNKISVVGIEVPNQAVTMVSLREVVGSDTPASRRRRCPPP